MINLTHDQGSLEVEAYKQQIADMKEIHWKEILALQRRIGEMSRADETVEDTISSPVKSQLLCGDLSSVSPESVNDDAAKVNEEMALLRE